MHSKLAKITAVIFLILFAEKAGLRLFIHDALHEKSSVHLAAPCKVSAGLPNIAKVSCDCLDDFFLPFSPAEALIVSSPAKPFSQNYFAQYQSTNPSFFLHAGLLRGPPLPMIVLA